jgi:hypothetical protein
MTNQTAPSNSGGKSHMRAMASAGSACGSGCAKAPRCGGLLHSDLVRRLASRNLSVEERPFFVGPDAPDQKTRDILLFGRRMPEAGGQATRISERADT